MRVKEYIAKGDATQASEKLYKAVKECIKVLALRYKLPENEKAQKDGRWVGYISRRAARRLAQDLGRKEIKDAWARAFDIHVWGFHEGKYEVEDIEQSIPYAEWLVDFVKQQEGLI
jgi:hypothetical protein